MIGGDPGEVRERARRVRAWAERKRDHDVRGLEDGALEEFRWMVEEYRVSVFAQELGVAVRVSPQRLSKQWASTRA